MKTIRCLVIPADDEAQLRIEEIERNNFLKLGDLVGGTFECIIVQDPACTLYVNEDGRRMELEDNDRATLLLRAFRPEFITESPIVGDVLIVGVPNGRGDDTSVPDSLRALLFDTKHYAVEVQMSEGAPYKRLNVTLDTWTLAFMYAVDILSRFSSMAAVRVVPAVTDRPIRLV